MSFTQTILGFAHHHPSLIGLVIFLAAMFEAIVVVGALVPGSAIIIILAGFVGAAHGRILPLVLAATAGAILADAGSFFFGRHYGARLREFWPFRTRPELIHHGTNFFERHGGKSVLFGRFLPGLRAVIPVAAGMLGMRSVIFFSASFVSALAWASIHIVPAAGAGVVLIVVGHISGRLIGAVLGFLVLLIVAAFLARLVANVIAPRLSAAYGTAIAGLAEAENPSLRRIGAWLDPARRNLRAHVVWGVVLLACTIGVSGIVRDLMNGDPLVRADAAISQLAQSLRTLLLDRLVVVTAAFGDSLAIAAATIVLLLVLVTSGARRTAVLVATVFIATAAFVPLIRFAFNEQRPLDLYPSFEAFTFPSSQATFTALFWGVLAVLAAPNLNRTGRVAAWAIGLVVAAMVGGARIYLNAHWPSDVFAGLLIGLAVTAIFALIFRDFESEIVGRLHVPILGLVGFLIAGAINASLTFQGDMVRYQPKITIRELPVAEWLDGGWQHLPLRRSDVFGETEERIIAQSTLPPDTLAGLLEKDGWKRTAPFTPSDLLFFLVPNAPLDKFVPLPLMHGGRLPDLTLIHADGDPTRRVVLRVWPSDIVVRGEKESHPLALVSLTIERVSHPYDALTILSDHPAGDNEQASVRATLTHLGTEGVMVTMRQGDRRPIVLLSPN